jgi:hypothetical protein
VDGTYNDAYYRISLHRRNNNQQHNRLRENAINFPETYYVAPEIDDVDGFNESFMNSQVVDISRIIPVNECNDINDGEQHYITYQAGNPNWLEHSEVKRHEKSYFGKDLGELFKTQKGRAERLDRDFAASLWQKQTDTTKKLLEDERRLLTPEQHRLLDEPQERTRDQFLKATADLTMTFFGATLVMVGEREGQ